MDPYAYVGDNPETRTNPTGQWFTTMTGTSEAQIINRRVVTRPGPNFGIQPVVTVHTALSTVYGAASGYTYGKDQGSQAVRARGEKRRYTAARYMRGLTGKIKINRRTKAATNLAEGFGDSAQAIERFSNILLLADGLLNGVSSSLDYSSKHKDVAGAITAGVLHGGRSTAGAYLGATIGEVGVRRLEP